MWQSIEKVPTKGQTPRPPHCHSISQFPQLNCKNGPGRGRREGEEGNGEAQLPIISRTLISLNFVAARVNDDDYLL